MSQSLADMREAYRKKHASLPTRDTNSRNRSSRDWNNADSWNDVGWVDNDDEANKPSTANSLNRYFEQSFDASKAQKVDWEERSRGAYSTTSKMQTAKNKAKSTKPDSIAEDSPARSSSFDKLDAFLQTSKSAPRKLSADTDDRSRGAHSTASKKVRSASKRTDSSDSLKQFFRSKPKAPKGDLETRSAFPIMTQSRKGPPKRTKTPELPPIRNDLPSIKEELFSFLSTLPKKSKDSEESSKAKSKDASKPSSASSSVEAPKTPRKSSKDTISTKSSGAAKVETSSTESRGRRRVQRIYSMDSDEGGLLVESLHRKTEPASATKDSAPSPRRGRRPSTGSRRPSGDGRRPSATGSTGGSTRRPSGHGSARHPGHDSSKSDNDSARSGRSRSRSGRERDNDSTRSGRSRSRRGHRQGASNDSRSSLQGSHSKLNSSRSSLHDSSSRLNKSKSSLHDSSSRLSKSSLHDSASRLNKSSSRLHDSSSQLNKSSLHDRSSRHDKSKSSLHDSSSRLNKSRSSLHDSASRLNESKSDADKSHRKKEALSSRSHSVDPRGRTPKTPTSMVKKQIHATTKSPATPNSDRSRSVSPSRAAKERYQALLKRSQGDETSAHGRLESNETAEIAFTRADNIKGLASPKPAKSAELSKMDQLKLSAPETRGEIGLGAAPSVPGLLDSGHATADGSIKPVGGVHSEDSSKKSSKKKASEHGSKQKTRDGQGFVEGAHRIADSSSPRKRSSGKSSEAMNPRPIQPVEAGPLKSSLEPLVSPSNFDDAPVPMRRRDAAPVTPRRRSSVETGKRPSGFVGGQSPPLTPSTFVEYNEEDIFTFYSWSLARQEPRKMQRERMILRETLRGMPLYRALRRIENV